MQDVGLDQYDPASEAGDYQYTPAPEVGDYQYTPAPEEADYQYTPAPDGDIYQYTEPPSSEHINEDNYQYNQDSYNEHDETSKVAEEENPGLFEHISNFFWGSKEEDALKAAMETPPGSPSWEETRQGDPPVEDSIDAMAHSEHQEAIRGDQGVE